LEDESEGSTCDLLGETTATSASPSSWSTIATPHFTVYERLQACWKPADPQGRILTGKSHQQMSLDLDLDYELELIGLPQHHVERHFATYQTDPPAFAGFSGGSFYQVDAIGKKPVYTSPDQPVKPVYVDPSSPIILEKTDFFGTPSAPFTRGKTV
jgi:hypothetical protein